MISSNKMEKCARALHTLSHTIALIIFGSTAIIMVTPQRVLAQKNESNSVRVHYEIEPCSAQADASLYEIRSGSSFYVPWNWGSNINAPRGIFLHANFPNDTVTSTDTKYMWLQPALECNCFDERWVNAISLLTYYYHSQGSRVLFGELVLLKKPEPHFGMSSSSQLSGDGGTLTLSAGHSITLTATTTNLGTTPTTMASHEWWFDQSMMGTGSTYTFTPSHGEHDVWVSLQNIAGASDVHATVVVAVPEEAGSCDDQMTDVVETDCDENNTHGAYAVAGGRAGDSNYGELWCLWEDRYVWSPSQGNYVLAYSTKVSCWMM